MFALLLSILLVSRASEGPALPLKALEGVEPHRVTVTDSWTEGYYSVQFEYHVKSSVTELARQIKADAFLVEGKEYPAGSSFLGSRYGEGISQSVSVYRRILSYVSSGPQGRTEGTKEDPFTTVVLTELVRPGDKPVRWLERAVSKQPPAPMIEIPTMPGVRAHTVSLTSFEGLMSSKGMRYVGRDAAVHQALVDSPAAGAIESFEEWATNNGYTRTRTGSWFKAGARLFEISVVRPGASSEGPIVVVAYTSDRKAVHPIVWEKF